MGVVWKRLRCLEEILLSWKRKRFQLNNIICSNIKVLEQIHALKWDHIVIPFNPDLLYALGKSGGTGSIYGKRAKPLTIVGLPPVLKYCCEASFTGW